MADTSFKLDVLQQLDGMALEAARHECLQMIQSANKTNPRKRGFLEQKLKNARSVQEIMKIMWNAYLAGEKLSTVGSKYQQRFGNATA